VTTRATLSRWTRHGQPPRGYPTVRTSACYVIHPVFSAQTGRNGVSTPLPSRRCGNGLHAPAIGQCDHRPERYCHSRVHHGQSPQVNPRSPMPTPCPYRSRVPRGWPPSIFLLHTQALPWSSQHSRAERITSEHILQGTLLNSGTGGQYPSAYHRHHIPPGCYRIPTSAWARSGLWDRAFFWAICNSAVTEPGTVDIVWEGECHYHHAGSNRNGGTITALGTRSRSSTSLWSVSKPHPTHRDRG